MTGAPFTAFDFRVEILLPGRPEPLCEAAFAECEGLELRLEVIALREGGNNAGPRLFPGRASCGEVTLRRGMTSSFDLWDWFGAVMADPTLRADVRVVMLAADGATEQARFRLRRCLPVRLRAPRLDASGSGIVAIEELRLACESLALERPGRPPAPGGLVKAELIELDPTRRRPVRPERRAVVQFNPDSLREVRTEAGATLSFALAMEAGSGEGADVRELTAALAYFADRPGVRFRWGSFRFDGRVVALEQEFDRFAPDGRALHASIAMTLAV